MIARIVGEGERLPRGYGITYRRYEWNDTVCHPVPLNWVVAAVRVVWIWLQRGLPRDPVRAAYSQGRRAGYDAGFAAGRRAALTEWANGLRELR